MTLLHRGLRMELSKLKRTLAGAMVILAPVVVVLLQFTVFVARRDRFLQPGTNPWVMMQTSIGLWTVLMLPLFITLETALLSALEHANSQWKQLFALPVPRWSIYASKLLAAVVIIGASFIILGAAIQFAGLLLRFIEPELAAGPAMWGELGRRLGFSFVASWIVIALHTWISLRWSNLPVAIGTGMTATVIGFFVANSDRLVLVYPWTLAVNSQRENAPLAGLMLYSVVATVLISVAGCWHVVRRDVTA